MTGGTFANYLASLDDSRLETVLKHRPDAMARPWPGTLSELISRLGSPVSIRAAYQQLPLPHVELLGIISLLHTLDQPTAADHIAKQVGVGVDVISRTLADLADRALIWFEPDGTIRTASRFAGIGVPQGWPIAMLLVEQSTQWLRAVSGMLGLPQDGAKPELIEEMTALFRDAGELRRIIEEGPDEQLIRRIADGERIPFFDPRGRPAAELQWAVSRALIWPGDVGQAELPLEVTLTLQSPGWHLPFHPDPPPFVLTVVDPEHVEQESRAAMLRLVVRVTQLIEAVEKEPIRLTKDGMVTVKTLRTFAKQWACTEDDSAFVFAITLLMLFIAPVSESPVSSRASKRLGPPDLKPTGEARRWHDAETVERARMLVETWWESTTAMIVHSRQAQPASGRYQQLRRAIVGVYASVRADEGREDCAAQLEWNSPLLVDDLEIVDRIMRESELVGATALGTATSLGRALIAGDPSVALAAIAGSAQSTATFGLDLTAVVFGQPDVAIAHLLDSVASREAQGAATTWRFTPGSIRRAFDAGSSAASLLAELSAIAANGVPQTLQYLLSDVERTYGNLVVSAVTCVVTSVEHALLHEVAAHRKLQGLGLRVLAPGVLASNASPDETLRAIREAGYSPVPEGGVVAVKQTEPVAVRRPRFQPGATVPDPDLSWHAKHLLENLDSELSTQPFMIMQALSGRCTYEFAVQLANGGVARLVHGMYEHVVHSPRVSGRNLTVWSVTTGKYETFPLRDIELSKA